MTSTPETTKQFAEIAPGYLWIGVPLPSLSGVLPTVGDDPGYEPHITMVMADFGEQTIDETVMAQIVARLADIGQMHEPLTGSITGYGRFYGDGANGDPVFAIPTIPKLESLRSGLVNALNTWDGTVAVSEVNGWVPHITLGYIPTGSVLPEIGIPETVVTVDSIKCVYAGREALINLSTYARIDDTANAAVVIAASDHGTPRLFSEIAFADVPEWWPCLPKPGVYEHPTYGEVDMSESVRDQIIENFNAHVYQTHIPVDTDHDIGSSGTGGYLRELRVNADGSTDVRVEATDVGKRLIESDRVKYVSPTILSSWTDYSTDPINPTKHEHVLIGLALTSRPFFKEAALRPLIAACETATKGTGMAETNQKPGEKEGADIVASKFGEQLAMAESRANEFEKKFTESQEQVGKLADEIKSLRDERQEEKFNEALKGCTDVPGRIAELKALPVELHEGYIKRAQAERDARTKNLNFSERGTDAIGEASAKAKLNAKAAALMEANPKLTQPQAFSEACKADANLYREYRAETQA